MQTAAVQSPEPHAWSGLGAHARLLTQHPVWLAAANETLAGPGVVEVTAGPAGCPHGLALLAGSGRRGRLRPLGEAELSEPGDLLASGEDGRLELARKIADLGRVFEFARLVPGAGTVEALREAWSGRGTVIVRPRPGTPRVELDDTWSDPLSHLGSRRRSDLRRARRRAEAMGPVELAIHGAGPNSWKGGWDEALRVEERSWKGEVGAAISQDPVRGAFYRAFAQHAGRAGLLRVALLRIADRPAAMQIAAAHAGAWWLLKVAFDPEFARCSPGQLLAVETLRHASEKGLSRYEFLGRPEPWTRLWADADAPCVRLVAYPRNARGLAGLGANAARAGWARARRLLPRRAGAEDA